MNLFLCFDGDHIGRQVGRAVLTDDVSEVRRVDQAINHGNEIWKSFALRAGGSVIEIGGDEGRIELGVDHLGEVADITRQYAEAVGATVSVGVGMKLSDSAKALAVAKLRGGNQIVLWTPEMQQELDAVPQKTEAEKIGEEYLSKGDEQHDTGKNRGAHAGFGGHHKPGSATTDKPKATQGDHDPAKVAQHTIKEGADAMPTPEMTHSADDLEQSLHDAAQAQEKDDTTSTVHDDMGLDQLKKQIVATLAGVKAQMPILAQLKQTAPDAYQSIMNLVQGVLALGKEVMKEQPPVDDTDPQHVEQGLGKSEHVTVTYRFPSEEAAANFRTEHRHECEDAWKGTACVRDQDGLLVTVEAWNGQNQAKSGKIAAKFDGEPVEDLDKAALKPQRHHLNLPVGSIQENRIKVAHADGKTSWVQAESGLIAGTEPGAPNTGMNTHPVSSRKPNAR